MSQTTTPPAPSYEPDEAYDDAPELNPYTQLLSNELRLAEKAEADPTKLTGYVPADKVDAWKSLHGGVSAIYFAEDAQGQQLGVAYLKKPSFDDIAEAMMQPGTLHQGAALLKPVAPNQPGGCLLNYDALAKALMDDEVKTGLAFKAASLLTSRVAALRKK